MLQELSNEINDLRTNRIEGIVITGDMNQDISNDQMQQFIRENGLYEIHQEMNEQEEEERDRTYKNG